MSGCSSSFSFTGVLLRKWRNRPYALKHPTNGIIIRKPQKYNDLLSDLSAEEEEGADSVRIGFEKREVSVRDGVRTVEVKAELDLDRGSLDQVAGGRELVVES